MSHVLDDLVDLLSLESIEENLFRGRSQDLGFRQLYGGQVLGQSLSAASQTVEDARHVHSLHGYFLRPGDASLVLLLAFVLPLGQLLVWVARVWEADLDARYIDFVWHSLALAIMAAALVTLCALALSYAQRRDPSPTARLWVRLATLGYAVPGTVLAVGLFIPVAASVHAG